MDKICVYSIVHCLFSTSVPWIVLFQPSPMTLQPAPNTTHEPALTMTCLCAPTPEYYDEVSEEELLAEMQLRQRHSASHEQRSQAASGSNVVLAVFWWFAFSVPHFWFLVSKISEVLVKLICSLSLSYLPSLHPKSEHELQLDQVCWF